MAAKKMCPVVHFEIPATELKRMTKFYTEAFGWESQQLGDDMGQYVLVSTAEHDARGYPKEVGRINGGLYPKDNAKPAQAQYPTIVIAVDDIKAAIEDVKKAGGTILGEPGEIPGYGIYVSFLDTEGNRNSMIQPVMP